MEDFERIKHYTAEQVEFSSTKMNIMKNWRQEIRRILINVRSEFIQWVDSFTNKFITSLKDIEQSKDLKEFNGEDRRLYEQLEGLRDKYVQILKIFTAISNASPDQKG